MQSSEIKGLNPTHFDVASIIIEGAASRNQSGSPVGMKTSLSRAREQLARKQTEDLGLSRRDSRRGVELVADLISAQSSLGMEDPLIAFARRQITYAELRAREAQTSGKVAGKVDIKSGLGEARNYLDRLQDPPIRKDIESGNTGRESEYSFRDKIRAVKRLSIPVSLASGAVFMLTGFISGEREFIMYGTSFFFFSTIPIVSSELFGED